jgi:hypothetical protein
MQSTPPVGGLVAGGLLAAGAVSPALAAVGLVAAVPGAIGLFHPALARASTDPPGVSAAHEPDGGEERGVPGRRCDDRQAHADP